MKTEEEWAKETGTQNQHSIKNNLGTRGTCCMRKAKQTYKQQINKANVKIKQRHSKWRSLPVKESQTDDFHLDLDWGLGHSRVLGCGLVQLRTKHERSLSEHAVHPLSLRTWLPGDSTNLHANAEHGERNKKSQLTGSLRKADTLT